MNTMKKIGVAILCGGLLLPSAVGATTSANTEELLAQIKALQGKIVALQQQVQTTKTQVKELKQEQKDTIIELKQTLKEGMSGDDIKALQALLSTDPSIYPEGKITGYYGTMTTKAVKRFQEKHGFEKMGYVGKKTLEKLNGLMKENPMRFEHATTTTGSVVSGAVESKKLCAIVPPGHLIAKGWLKNNEKPLVPTCQTLPEGIAKKLEVTTATLPEISLASVSLSSVTATTSVISWQTNRPATGSVWYGTVNPVNTIVAPAIYDPALVSNHSFKISGLSTSTIYYYVVASKDSSVKTATSTQGTFTTLPQ